MIDRRHRKLERVLLHGLFDLLITVLYLNLRLAQAKLLPNFADGMVSFALAD